MPDLLEIVVNGDAEESNEAQKSYNFFEALMQEDLDAVASAQDVDFEFGEEGSSTITFDAGVEY